MEYAKLDPIQMLSLRLYMRIAKGDLEDAIYKHYKVHRIEDIKMKDYDEVVDMIHSFITEERQWNKKI